MNNYDIVALDNFNLKKTFIENEKSYFDPYKAIENLSEKQRQSLTGRLITTLSTRLGNSVNDSERFLKADPDIFDFDPDIIIPPSLLQKEEFTTTLKQHFLDIIGHCFWVDIRLYFKLTEKTYSLEDLKNRYVSLKSTPHLDQMVIESVSNVAQQDKDYVLGFALDKNETEKQQQLVFAIFEKNGIIEISRTLIPELEL